MCYTDISDETWQRLEPVLPLEGSPKGGRPAKDKRTFINHKCNHLVAAYWGFLEGPAKRVWVMECRVFPLSALADERILESSFARSGV